VPHDKYEEDNEFPILDLSGCLLDHPLVCFVRQVGHGNDDELITKKMVEAAEKWGFFGVMNHSVSIELITHLQAHARRFFNLRMEQKLNGGRTEKIRTAYVAGSPNFFPQKWWSEAVYFDCNPTQLQQFFERVWSQECDYHDIQYVHNLAYLKNSQLFLIDWEYDITRSMYLCLKVCIYILFTLLSFV
jgi:hypothetical protein